MLFKHDLCQRIGEEVGAVKMEEKIFKILLKASHSIFSQDDICALFADKFGSAVIQHHGGAELYLKESLLNDFLVYVEELKKKDFVIEFSIETFDDVQWEKEWKRFIKPVEVGSRLFIRPSWIEPPKDLERIDIIIDPEMAFGTGHHETTQLCLEWLENFSNTNDVSKMTVLDVGTGSGIISIAAIKLGFRYAVGIDIDLTALSFAKKNVRKNRVDSNVSLVAGTPDCIRGNFDVIVANINVGVLVNLAPVLKNLVKGGAIVVLSGILRDQKDYILHAYKRMRYKKIGSFGKGEWCLFCFIIS